MAKDGNSGCGVVIAVLLLAIVAMMFLGRCNRPAAYDAAAPAPAPALAQVAPPAPVLAAKVISIECTERGGMGYMRVTIQNTGNATIAFAKAFADFSTKASGVVSDDSYFSPADVPPGARASADMYLRHGDVTNCQLRTVQSNGTLVQLTPPG